MIDGDYIPPTFKKPDLIDPNLKINLSEFKLNSD